MSTFTDAGTFGYLFDDVVYVRVKATNSYGYGALSDPCDDTGARIRSVPSKMLAPTESLLSTDTEILLSWIPLTGVDAGNSDIIAYSLYWDEGDSLKTEADVPLYDANVDQFTVMSVTGGVTYRFRVRARNIYGDGPFSDETIVIPDDAPGKADIATVELAVSPTTSVQISWPLPNEHSATITKYDIYFEKSNGDYAMELTACDGSDSTIVSARSCIVPMSTIRSLTLLPRDSLIRVKVRAYNARGTGQFSELNTDGATIETVPTNLMVVTLDVPSTSNTQTKVTWTALTGSARGGQAVLITSYEVYWDQSTGVWESLTSTSDLFALKTGLTGGTTYSFKVRAYNKYGEGDFTEVVTIQTSQAPEVPTAPTVEIVGGYVKISWDAPFENYRPILGYGYQVLIGTNAGTFVEKKTLCDGVAQEATRYCLVDMHELRASPFNLAYEDLVQAKVLAANERGWSAESPANTDGAHVEVEPSAVVTPARGILTGPTQLDVYWTALSLYDAGGSAVLSYHLQYDNATAATTWLDVVGLAPDSMLLTVIVSTNVESGSQYNFRVRARNIFGWGPYSQVA